jgi:hypothetical protein
MVPSARPSGLDEAVFDPERGTARTSLASERCTRGISDHSTPSSSRPPAFGVRPPLLEEERKHPQSRNGGRPS